MRVERRGDYYDDFCEPNHPWIVGSSGSYMHPWDWDDDTAQELADELDEQLKRKRQPGFTAPWRNKDTSR